MLSLYGVPILFNDLRSSLSYPIRFFSLQMGQFERAIDLSGRFSDVDVILQTQITRVVETLSASRHLRRLLSLFFYSMTDAFCQGNFLLLQDSMERVGRTDDHWICQINGSVTERSLS